MPAELLGEPHEILEGLRQRQKDSQGEPAVRPKALPRSTLRQYPEVFQVRQEDLDERHLQELAKAIKQRGVLDPILVIQVSGEVVVVDGHHRVEAYRLAKVCDGIPVVYFEGTVDEAVLESGRANSKAKLPMTTRQRMDFAWRLTVMGSYSKSQTVDAAAVGDGTVGRMRRVKKALGDEATGCRSWWQAQRLHKATMPVTEMDLEDWMETRANELADRMAKTFGPDLHKNPEIAARALAVYLGRRTGEVWRYLKDHVADVELEEDEDADF